MRSGERSSSVTVGGRTWLLFLAALLALASAAAFAYLTVRIASGEQEFADGQRELTEEEPALSDGVAELKAGKRELSEGRQAYADAEDQWHLVWADRLLRGGKGFREGAEQIAEAERDIAAGEGRLSAGQDRMDEGRMKLQRGREQLILARRVRWVSAGCAVLFAAGAAAIGFHRRRTAA